MIRGPLVSLSALGLMMLILSGCGPNVSLAFVVNHPYKDSLVTAGDYRVTGGVSAHLTDQAGSCVDFDPNANGAQAIPLISAGAGSGRTLPREFLSLLDAQTADQAAQVLIAIVGFDGTGTYRLGGSVKQTTVVLLHVGDPNDLQQLLTAQDPGQRLFIATDPRDKVTLSQDAASGAESGSVAVTLQEIQMTQPPSPAAGTTTKTAQAPSLQPIPGAPTVHLTGTFRCVEPST